MFDRAIEIDSANADVWYNKGYTLYILGKDNDAIECFDRAIELKPSYSKVYLFRGEAKYQTGYIMEALDDFNRIVDNALDDQKHNNKGLATIN